MHDQHSTIISQYRFSITYAIWASQCVRGYCILQMLIAYDLYKQLKYKTGQNCINLGCWTLNDVLESWCSLYRSSTSFLITAFYGQPCCISENHILVTQTSRLLSCAKGHAVRKLTISTLPINKMKEIKCLITLGQQVLEMLDQ